VHEETFFKHKNPFHQHMPIITSLAIQYIYLSGTKSHEHNPSLSQKAHMDIYDGN